VQDTKGPINGLPTVSYGPWSQVYTSTNPDFAQGPLTIGDAVSDTTSTPTVPTPHQIVPVFTFTGDQPLSSADCISTLAPRCELFRVYIFSDSDCVNVVYKGAVVGSPAYAPRITGPLMLPGDTKKLAGARIKNLTDGVEGKVFASDGAKITTTEAVAPSVFTATLIQQQAAASGAGSSSSSSSSSSSTSSSTPAPPQVFPTSLSGQGAPVDLWDTQWPSGRYYWTVVPVQYYIEVQPDADPSAPAPANPPLVSFDQDVPQDE